MSVTYIVYEPPESSHGKYFPLEAAHAEIDEGLVHYGNLLLVDFICAHGADACVDAMVVLVADCFCIVALCGAECEIGMSVFFLVGDGYFVHFICGCSWNDGCCWRYSWGWKVFCSLYR